MEQSIILLNTTDLKSVISEALKEVLQNYEPKPSSHPTPRKYTREQLGEVLQVSMPTIHGMMNQGLLPYVKVGRRTLFDADAVDTLVASGQLKKYRRNRR